MAITLKVVTLSKKFVGKTLYARSFYSVDVSGAELILAAHATRPYYITRLIIAIDLDGLVDFGDGEDSSAVETVALQLIGTATGLVYDLDFSKNPIKLTAAKPIAIDAAGAGLVAGYVECFTVD